MATNPEKSAQAPEKTDTNPLSYWWLTTNDPARHRAMYCGHTGRQAVVTVNAAAAASPAAAADTTAQPSAGSPESGAVDTITTTTTTSSSSSSSSSASAPSTDVVSSVASSTDGAAAAPPQKKRGRPLGSKNKPKVDAAAGSEPSSLSSGVGEKRKASEGPAEEEPAAKRSRGDDAGEDSGVDWLDAMFDEAEAEEPADAEDDGDNWLDAMLEEAEEPTALRRPSPENNAADTPVERSVELTTPPPARRTGLTLPSPSAAVVRPAAASPPPPADEPQHPAAPSPEPQPDDAVVFVAARPRARKPAQERPARPAEEPQPAPPAVVDLTATTTTAPAAAASPGSAAAGPAVIAQQQQQQQPLELPPQMPWSQQIVVLQFRARERDAREAAAAAQQTAVGVNAFRRPLPGASPRWALCLPRSDRADEWWS